MLTIGIDPGTAITGYGVISSSEGGAIQVVDFGVIRTHSKLASHQRLLELYEGLSEILQLHRPVQGAVEKIFFQRNVKTAIQVGQARGVALLALAEGKVEVGEYTPSEIKMAVSGYGGASKHQIQEMVRVLLNMEKQPKPDDAADALAVAICHVYSSSFRSRVEKGL